MAPINVGILRMKYIYTVRLTYRLFHYKYEFSRRKKHLHEILYV